MDDVFNKLKATLYSILFFSAYSVDVLVGDECLFRQFQNNSPVPIKYCGVTGSVCDILH